jgi:uncharacterized protein (DUF427 family)
MSSRRVLTPSADHPITVTTNPLRIVVKVGDTVVADTHEALTLREANYPAVQYVPRRDINMSLLARSDHTSYCPFKGDANYFNLKPLGDRGANAVWTYDAPYPAVAAIAGHVAFYPDRVTITEHR